MRLLLIPIALVTVTACGGSEKPDPQTPTNPCPPGSVQSASGCVASTPPPAPSSSSQPPLANNPALPPMQAPGPAATPVDVSLVAPLLDPLARQYLPPGAKPVGPALAGQFKPGQSLEQPVQLQPGKCYTVVGAAAPSVQNLDIQLLPLNPLGPMSPIVAQDQTTGATAVLGAAPNCFHWAAPMSMPMRVVITAAAGEGLAGAQVYEK